MASSKMASAKKEAMTDSTVFFDGETPVSVRPETALLLKTLHCQHDLLLQRLDTQELLLKRAASGSFGSPASPLFDAESPLSPVSDPRSEASHSVANSGAFSAALQARSESRHVTLRSYTEEDVQLRDEAENAQSMSMRKRFSANPGNTQTRSMDSNSTPWSSRIVHHPAFDVFFAMITLGNAIFIGFDIQRVLDGEPRLAVYRALSYSFSTFFLGELLLRLADSRCRYYCSEDWGWALLDTLIVATAWWDILLEIVEAVLQEDYGDSISGLSTLKAMRIVRLTRVLKTAHFLRIFRFILALRMLVQSILHTVKALFWALLLLGLIVYVFAILFAQAVFDYFQDPTNPALPEEVQEAANRYFGSLLRSMLALFMSIAGGVSWEEVVTPLGYISAFWELCFLFYIAFSYLAVLNVVTAVFCQSAIESAGNDHATVVQNMIEHKEQHLQKLRDLFNKMDGYHDGGITFPMFEEKINNSPAVRDYFESLGLDVYEPWSFFKLLDSDNGGVVELEEFFLGCIRFSGDATAMEVGRLAADQRWLIKSQGAFQKFVEDELHQAKDNLASLANAVCTLTRGIVSTEM